MNDSSKTKVRLAADMLDKTVPGWHNLVDPKKLQMASCTYCVLGQIFGRDNEERLLAIVGERVCALPGEEGFNPGRRYLRDKANYSATHPAFGAFGDVDKCLWIVEIAERRANEDNDDD